MTCSHIGTAFPSGVLSRSVFKSPSCASCGKSGEVWLCLTCGYAGCGRLEAGHMAKHQRAAGHAVAMNARTTVMWCRLCDSEVDKEELRSELNSWLVSSTKPTAKGIKAVRGVVNVGNTCFLAAAMQCLSHTFPLQKTLRHCPPVHENPTAPQRLVSAVCSFFKAQWEQKSAAPIDPTELLTCVQRLNALFHGFQQHDAQEFLRFLLTTVHEELRWPVLPCKSGQTSIISDVFAGTSRSVITCDNCGKESHCVEQFYDLSLPIPEDTQPSSWWVRAKTFVGLLAEPPVSLAECFRQFSQPEHLSGSNAYYCEHCKAKHACMKEIRIERWPEVLVVHLKRFRHGDYGASKISHRITEFSWNSYRLTGFIQHLGSASGGHYIAYNRHKSSQEWYCFDDTRVTRVNTVEHAEPYVLFFQKVVQPQTTKFRSQLKVAMSTNNASSSLVSRRWLMGALSMSVPPSSEMGLICPHGLPSSSCPAFAATQFIALSACKGAPPGPREIAACPTCLVAVERYNFRLAQEHKLVTKLDTKNLASPTDNWFFIDAAWVAAWRQYLRHGAIGDVNRVCDPGPIENTVLVKKKSPKINTDYIAVNETVFSIFAHCHGVQGAVLRGPLLDLASAEQITDYVAPVGWDVSVEDLARMHY